MYNDTRVYHSHIAVNSRILNILSSNVLRKILNVIYYVYDYFLFRVNCFTDLYALTVRRFLVNIFAILYRFISTDILILPFTAFRKQF